VCIAILAEFFVESPAQRAADSRSVENRLHNLHAMLHAAAMDHAHCKSETGRVLASLFLQPPLLLGGVIQRGLSGPGLALPSSLPVLLLAAVVQAGRNLSTESFGGQGLLLEQLIRALRVSFSEARKYHRACDWWVGQHGVHSAVHQQGGGPMSVAMHLLVAMQLLFDTPCGEQAVDAMAPSMLHALLQLLDCMMMTVAPALARVVSS
jgi:hypothetical protein